jgi:hypothetical protein
VGNKVARPMNGFAWTLVVIDIDKCVAYKLEEKKMKEESVEIRLGELFKDFKLKK